MKKYFFGSIALVALLAILVSALPVMAVNTKLKAETRLAKKLDPICAKAAVDKRETAVGASFSAFSDSMSAAFANRKTQLLAAWDLTDVKARANAVTTAAKVFRQAKLAAAKAYKTRLNTSWQQFKTDRLACGVSATGENPNADMLNVSAD
jgi:hypothetical protein